MARSWVGRLRSHLDRELVDPIPTHMILCYLIAARGAAPKGRQCRWLSCLFKGHGRSRARRGCWRHDGTEWVRPDSGKPHVPYAWIADMLRADGAKGQRYHVAMCSSRAGFFGWLHARMLFDEAIPGCEANKLLGTSLGARSAIEPMTASAICNLQSATCMPQ